MRAAVVLLTVALAALAASVSHAAVAGGTIAVNRGAAGVRLFMTRATVVDRLGPPIYKNANGFMEYGAEPNLFDVYLGGRHRVRLIGISGRHFCTKSGICMLTRNGLKRLRAQWGSRLKTVETEDGETLFVVRGRYKGRRVFTSFATGSLRPRAKIIQVFIGRCPPRPAVCGA